MLDSPSLSIPVTVALVLDLVYSLDKTPTCLGHFSGVGDTQSKERERKDITDHRFGEQTHSHHIQGALRILAAVDYR